MKDQSNAARSDTPENAGYPGPERRRHRVYMTRNTEYHFRDGFCVAVRDRRTGDFLQGHLALQRRIHGGLKFFEGGGIAPNAGEPRTGESLYFASEGRDLVTSPLEGVERPAREIVAAYPSRRTRS
ncbi:MAG TPA: hypothetical protein VGG39_12085 [Polyangiaceae bacterium]|jgi:hypothetical protein